VKKVSEAKSKGWMGPLILAVILVLLIWPVLYFARNWAAYWGLWLLSVIFAFTVLYMRTKYFWEE
jgi:hypothetical protein